MPSASQILTQLARAYAFEEGLRTRIPAGKLFGLGGAETFIVLLETLLGEAARGGVAEVVVGGMHRGRFNMLATVMGKPLTALVAEIEGKPAVPAGLGVSSDVSYHLGYSGERTIGGRKLRLSVSAHPSHLQLIPVISQGRARAKQSLAGEHGRHAVLPLLLHTDASFAGQGLVAEMLQLSAAGAVRHRRHHPHRHQQPGRLHHHAGRRPLGPPCDRHRQADRGAGAARQRRRPRGRRPRGARGGRLSRRVRRRHPDRSRLLPPAGPQRDRRAALHAPGHVSGRRRAPAGAPALRRRAGEARPRYQRRRGRRSRKFAQDMRSAFAAAKSYQVNHADWFEGRWSGLRSGSEADMLAATATGLARDTLRELGRSAHRHPRRHGRRPQGGALPGRAAHLDRDRRRHHLGDGRGPRAGLAPVGRHARPSRRPGQRARHLHPAPSRVARPGHRRAPSRPRRRRGSGRRARPRSTTRR